MTMFIVSQSDIDIYFGIWMENIWYVTNTTLYVEFSEVNLWF